MKNLRDRWCKPGQRVNQTLMIGAPVTPTQSGRDTARERSDCRGGRSSQAVGPRSKQACKVVAKPKRVLTAAQRKAIGERMRKYWAARREAQAPE